MTTRRLELTLFAAFSTAWLLPRAAAAGPLVLEVRPSAAPSPRAAPPLVLARTDAALRLARRDYTGSNFARCVQRLQHAETALARVLRDPSDWLLLKRVTHWLGLCLAVSGQTDAARAVFRRGSGLPGPQLDGAIAPPSVVRLSRETAGVRCSLVPPSGVHDLKLDGGPAAPGSIVEQGEHFAAWRTGGGVRSGRVRVDESCRLALPDEQPGPDPRSLQIDPAEAADPELLRHVAIAAGVRHVWLLHVDGRVRVFDLLSGTLEERDRSALAAAEGKAARTPAFAPPAARPSPARDERPRWYRRWWIWALVGAAAAAVVAVPVALTRPQRYDVTFAPTPP